MQHALSPELRLAAMCCSWPPTVSADERIASLASRVSDWGRFEELVRHHRIRPLVYASIVRAGISVPGPITDRLKKAAYVALEQSLRMANEGVRMEGEFRQSEIPMLIVKGVPLAVLAYGNIGIKEAWDIDLLVSKEDAPAARHLLLRLGYQLTDPQLTEDEFARFINYSKEAGFRHSTTNIMTELHWRLLDSGNLLNFVDAKGASQDVLLPTGTLRTLADEPLFAYLCLHGASHNWFRLKWLADVNAFLGKRSNAEVELLLKFAKKAGAGRSASVALQLCCELFDRSLSADIQRELETSTISQRLRNNVLSSLSYRGGGIEPAPYTLQWLRVLLAAFFVSSDRNHVLAQARFLWNAPLDRARIALPPRLEFLYHIVRMPLWLHRVVMRRLRRAG